MFKFTLCMHRRAPYRVFLLLEEVQYDIEAVGVGTWHKKKVIGSVKPIQIYGPKFNMSCSMTWLKQHFRRLELKRRTTDPPELHVRMLIKVKNYFGTLHGCASIVHYS